MLLRSITLGLALALGAAPAAPATPRAAFKLAFLTGPTSTIAGSKISPAVQVQLQNAAGQRITTSGVRLGVMLGNDPSGGVLHGATASVTQNGIATFADLSLDKVGIGYTLYAFGRDAEGIESAPFDVAAAPAAALRFQTNPNNAPAWNTLAAVDVAVVDAYGNAAANPNFPITLSLGANPGTNLIHASGSVGNPVLELVDHQTPALLPPVVNPGPKSVSAMIYEPNVGKIFAADLSNSLSLIDPQSGSQQFLGATGALPTAVKALVFGPVHHALLAGLITEGNLYVVDPMTGVASLLGLLTIPGDGVLNVSGLAVDPTTQQIFAISQLGSVGPDNRALITIDESTLAAHVIGLMGDRFSGLAFRPDGSLIAVSGDGGANAEKLFTVDKQTGATSVLFALGNGDSGETIAMIPAQLRGTLTKNTSAGLASFGDLRVTAPAGGYTLRASAPGLEGAESRLFGAAAPDLSGIVAFGSASQTVSESVGTVTVPLTLSQAQSHDVVAWINVTGSALGPGFPGADTDLPGFIDIPITIPAGQLGTNITFHVIDDSTHENAETVILTLKRIALGTLGSAIVHTVTIQDND
jgi:hypothetical protein